MDAQCVVLQLRVLWKHWKEAGLGDAGGCEGEMGRCEIGKVPREGALH